MLQQTTVAAVVPYYLRFLERFPTVEALAAAPQEEVLRAWAGLGYYSRGRNLHAAAQAIAATGWPRDEAGLRVLPGVGAYTAAAIAAIAFGEAATVVDGNVERVMARLFGVEAPLPAAKPALRALAQRFTGPERPGDFAQALMDLGATVCTPKSPRCPCCPLNAACRAFAQGDPAALPRKAAKAAKVLRHGVAFMAVRGGEVFLMRRPERGLLGGMPALPTTPWRAEPWPTDSWADHAPLAAAWRNAGAVEHVFTHFPLTLTIAVAQVKAAPAQPGWWAPLEADHAFPAVFEKAFQRGRAGLSDQP
jgi:A/G-specific adenine glycosylase